MRVLLIVILIIFAKTALSQRWAIRPELLFTAAKAKFVSNTNPYPPFRGTYSNNLDANLHVDYYLKKNSDRITFTIGTYQNSFTMTNNKNGEGNGFLGFISPDFFLSEGTPFSILTSLSYGKNLSKTSWKSSIFLLGGIQYFIVQPNGIGGSGGDFGSFVLLGTELNRAIKGNLGWQAGICALIKNKKHREVLQVSCKYLGTFNTTQFTNDYFYSMITPANPPEILDNQVIKYRLTGAGVQIGLSKTLKYFPGQRKKQKM